MDTNRIRYFLSLARTGSLSRAAELHRISPAAFSKAMKIFEMEVGEKILLPSGRGVILTDFAKGLVPELTEVINKLDRIRDHRKSNEKKIRIATFEVFSTYFMSHAIKEQFKDYHCEILESIPGKMELAVASGHADLALTYNPVPHPDLDFLKVQEIEMGMFGKNKDLPFVVPLGPVEGSPTKVRGLDGWPDNAFPRNIQFEVTLLETALGLCREGLAVAYLPKFVVELHNKIVKPSFQLNELDLPKSFKRQKDYVYLIKRKSDKEGSEAKKLAQIVRKVTR